MWFRCLGMCVCTSAGAGPPDVTRRDHRGQGQTDLPAEQSAAGEGSRIPVAHAHPRWSGDRVVPPAQGPRFPDCLTHRTRVVLPARNRMRRSDEFGSAVRSGVRAAQPDLVVHARRQTHSVAGDSPQIGLIVTKSVGGAVDRHRVARRLRHASRAVLAELDPGDRIVIRALPSSRDASSSRLEQQIHAGVRRASNLLARAT